MAYIVYVCVCVWGGGGGGGGGILWSTVQLFNCSYTSNSHFDGLVQDCSIPIANTLQSCTKPLI